MEWNTSPDMWQGYTTASRTAKDADLETEARKLAEIAAQNAAEFVQLAAMAHKEIDSWRRWNDVSV